MANFNPIEVEKAIKGIAFPADKEQLRDQARENGASDTVMAALDKLPEREYQRANDVTGALGGDQEDTGIDSDLSDDEIGIDVEDEQQEL